VARDRRPYGSETDDGTSVEGGGATAGHEHRHPPDPSAGTRRVTGLHDNTEQTVSDPPPCDVRERTAQIRDSRPAFVCPAATAPLPSGSPRAPSDDLIAPISSRHDRLRTHEP
jgi:hypothetical protein